MATTTLTPTSATPDTPKVVKKAGGSDIKGPSLTPQTVFGCQHIKSLLQAARDQATNGYTRIVHSLRNEANFSGYINKSGDKTHTRLTATYLCLQCPNVSSSRERHRKDHAFAVESDNGYIYCHDCKDFVYDPTFEEIRSTSSKKRKHAALQADGESKRLIANNAIPTPCSATGLRGFYNMGQTCFMSVILQSIVHNPLIRTYYLSEGHRNAECEREACTSCALDDIFTEFFGQEKHEGFGAVHMLQGCWKGGGGLAGYSQQDAHEYLGSFLNILHVANTDDDEFGTGKDSFTSNDSCDCIVHQTFGGMLKSAVTCSACKNTSTALDPFMDLSLDVRSTAVSAKKQKPNPANHKLPNGTAHKETALPMDLSECLDRFTSAETLSSDSYHCRKCASPQTATKKMSLTRLPPVVPIHLKRFSHSKSLSQSSKVETKIRFPFSLDLTPYSAASSSKSKAGAEHTKTDKIPNGTSTTAKASNKDSAALEYTPPNPIYDLSSVVVHKGKIDNGHYISYSRQGDEWFRFDDSMVVQVDDKEVLGAEAYMLFYVVRELPLSVGDDA